MAIDIATTSYQEALGRNKGKPDWDGRIPRRFLADDEYVVDVLAGTSSRDAAPLFVLTGHRFLHLPLKFFGSHYLADEVPLSGLTGVETEDGALLRRGSVTVHRGHGAPMRLKVIHDEDAQRFAQTVRDVMAGRARLTPPPEPEGPSPAMRAILRPGEEILATAQTIEGLKRAVALAVTDQRVLHLEFSLETEELRVLREEPAGQMRAVRMSTGILRDTITVTLAHGEPITLKALRRPAPLHEANKRFVAEAERLLAS